MRCPWCRHCSLSAGTLLGLLLLVGCAQPSPPVEVFLVRHAEKVDTSSDAKLSAVGMERARTLARLLGEAGIEQVHSTDFARTRDTAGPLADLVGSKVNIYDHKDLSALVRAVHARGGRHLIVGHSNTTPEVVQMLGGDPGAPLDEASEYDRLYLVSRDSQGRVSTYVLRYGAGVIQQP